MRETCKSKSPTICVKRIRGVASSALLLFLLIQPVFGVEFRATKRVLVLFSEDKDHPAHGMTERGIREGFLSNKLFDVQVYTEYLDGSRFRNSDHDRIMANYLNRKYADTKIDAIIAVYPASLDFLHRKEGPVLPEVPVVGCEIDRHTAETLDQSPWRRLTTGVVMGDNIENVLEGALLIKPGTMRVALVAGTGPNDFYSELLFRKALKAYAEKIEVIDLTKLPMQEIVTRVGSLPPYTIILYSNIFMDGAGRSFVPRKALSLISAAANAPVFSFSESYLGYGIVGGHLVSMEKQGREAASMVLRIIGGEPPASIPFGGDQAYVDIYDWRELKRWGISERSLPSGSIVMYKPQSIWKEHWLVILGSLVFMILETILIIGLFVSLRQRRKANELARKSRDDYQELSGKLLTVQETERRKLARELHDDLSQRLAALAIEMGFIEGDSTPTSLEAAAKVQKIGRELVNLSGSVHSISRRLHPSILDDLGLVDAIRSECDGLSRREQIEVHFEVKDCQQRAPQDVSLCLYRVTQESLRNVVKHARASIIHVSLTGEKDMLHLLIKDNGRGFILAHIPGQHGLGLISMRERVRLIQGEIMIESQPGQGTTIKVRAPFTDLSESLDAGEEKST